MSKTESMKNPFRAGVATEPWRLVGRDDVQNHIKKVIEPIFSHKEAKYTPTILYGPRGMGKTVLLLWAAEKALEMARKKDVKMEVLYSSGQQELVDISGIKKLKPWGRKPRIGKRAFEKIGSILPGKPFEWAARISGAFNFGLFRGEGQAEGRWKRESAGSREFEEGRRGDAWTDNYQEPEHAPIFDPSHQRDADALFARCRRKPVLLLIDEAHTYPIEFKKSIIAIAATAITKKLPFYLILAGTPGIISRDGMKKLTYWERVEKKHLGRLDRKSTGDAIMLPLKEDGIAISDDALDIIFKESHGYPYFIQRWGQVLWDHAEQQGITSITKKEIGAVWGDINKYRNGFYWNRYAAIRDEEYLAAHYAAARAMDRGRSLSPIVLANVIAEAISRADGAGAEKAAAFAQALEAGDFLWSPDGVYQPGIPSFMHYLRDRVRLDLPEMAKHIDDIQDTWTRDPYPQRMDRPLQPEIAPGRNEPVPGHTANIRRRSPVRHPQPFGGQRHPADADKSDGIDPSGRGNDEGQ